jgi:hypothetical protein
MTIGVGDVKTFVDVERMVVGVVNAVDIEIIPLFFNCAICCDVKMSGVDLVRAIEKITQCII